MFTPLSMFKGIYQDKTVLLTGDTGFKGSWLALWLLRLNAHIVGYSLDPPSQPSHHQLLSLNYESVTGDIRHQGKLHRTFESCRPDIVFHLAAQPLVRRSYGDPVGTFETNVMGTLHVLEGCRRVDSVKAIVVVTSDKCYLNREWPWGYREIDPLGGHDPYSASKGCSELLTASYRRSFFPVDSLGKAHCPIVASARAGNIMGGGDWGEDRLVPDVARAAGSGRSVAIRNPHAVRPWQHVLDPLAGYLMLGQALLEGRTEACGAWNFGPDTFDQREVIEVVREMQQIWPAIAVEELRQPPDLHEAGVLRLDCSKTRAHLGWRPVWRNSGVIEKTIRWYREFYESNRLISHEQLDEYITDAVGMNLPWVSQ